MLFLFQALGAQSYTYLGGGISLHAAHLSSTLDSRLTKGSEHIHGGAYDVTLRQEINYFLSLETGISMQGLEYFYVFMDEFYTHFGGFYWHTIPLKVEIEVDVLQDRIAAYGSFGYQFCVRTFDNYGHTVTSFSGDAGSVDMEWDYISDSRFHSLFRVGAGSRFRLVDELLFELELGYVFSLKDMVYAHFMYRDTAGKEQSFTQTEGLDFWYLQGGFAYPVQRIVEMVRGVL